MWNIMPLIIVGRTIWTSMTWGFDAPLMMQQWMWNYSNYSIIPTWKKNQTQKLCRDECGNGTYQYYVSKCHGPDFLTAPTLIWWAECNWIPMTAAAAGVEAACMQGPDWKKKKGWMNSYFPRQNTHFLSRFTVPPGGGNIDRFRWI